MTIWVAYETSENRLPKESPYRADLSLIKDEDIGQVKELLNNLYNQACGWGFDAIQARAKLKTIAKCSAEVIAKDFYNNYTK